MQASRQTYKHARGQDGKLASKQAEWGQRICVIGLCLCVYVCECVCVSVCGWGAGWGIWACLCVFVCAAGPFAIDMILPGHKIHGKTCFSIAAHENHVKM